MKQAPSLISQAALPLAVRSMMQEGKIHPIATAAVAPVIVCTAGGWVAPELRPWANLIVAGVEGKQFSCNALQVSWLCRDKLGRTMTGQMLGTATATAYVATTVTAVMPIQATLPTSGCPTITSAITCVPAMPSEIKLFLLPLLRNTYAVRLNENFCAGRVLAGGGMRRRGSLSARQAISFR